MVMAFIGIVIIVLAYLQLIAWGSIISGGLAILMLIFGSWWIAKGLESNGKGTVMTHENKQMQEQLRKFDYQNHKEDKN